MVTPTVRRVLVLLTTALVLTACRTAEDNSDGRLRSPPGIHETAFRALKTGDAALADSICLTQQDIVWLAALDQRRSGQPLSPDDFADRAKELSMRAREKVRNSLVRVRRETAEMGFDWPNAVLERVALEHESGFLPGLPGGQAMEADIRLHITSGDKSIAVVLDECFLVEDVRKTRDGFKLRSVDGG